MTLLQLLRDAKLQKLVTTLITNENWLSCNGWAAVDQSGRPLAADTLIGVGSCLNRSDSNRVVCVDFPYTGDVYRVFDQDREHQTVKYLHQCNDVLTRIADLMFEAVKPRCHLLNNCGSTDA